MTKGLPASAAFQALVIGKAGSGVWRGEGGREKMFSLKKKKKTRINSS